MSKMIKEREDRPAFDINLREDILLGKNAFKLILWLINDLYRLTGSNSH